MCKVRTFILLKRKKINVENIIYIYIYIYIHLRHSSFSNHSLALPTSQLILQPFRCFTYVTVHSPTFLLLLLRHRIFSYVTWRAAHGINCSLHKELPTTGLPISSLVHTLNVINVITTFYPTIYYTQHSLTFATALDGNASADIASGP